MEELKELLRKIFRRYCIVFTLVVTANVIINYVSTGRSALFQTKDMIAIEIMALLCGFGDLFFIHEERDTKKQNIIRSIIHYVYINVVVLGVVLGYTNINFINVLLTLVSIAVIYGINSLATFCQQKKDATKMNDILHKINNNDE